MAVIYLDWNVFTAARRGMLDAALLPVLRDVVARGLAVVPFTAEHVIEAARGLTDTETDRERLRAALDGIAGLTGGVYWSIDHETGHDLFSRWDPHEAHDHLFGELVPHSSTIQAGDYQKELVRIETLWEFAVTTHNETIRLLASQAGLDFKELTTVAAPRTPADAMHMAAQMLEACRRAGRTVNGGPLGLDPMRLSAPGREHEAIARIEERLQATGSTVTMKVDGLLAENAARHPGPIDFRAAQINALLQLSGFRRDPPKKSADNLSSDSQHLTYGLRAALFVTLDGRLRARAEVIAAHIGAETVIVSPDEAVPLLRAAVEHEEAQ